MPNTTPDTDKPELRARPVELHSPPVEARGGTSVEQRQPELSSAASVQEDPRDERPVTRVEHAWRVLLVGFLAFVIVGCLRLSVHAPDGAAWLSVAGLCLAAVLALSVVLIVQARRAQGTRSRRERGGAGYGRRVRLSSVILVTIAVIIVIGFNYGLANMAPSGIK